MANTVIQIKRSSSTAAPTAGSLAAAEPAYSFNSDKLFIGNTAGTGVIEIGGKYWVDAAVAAFAQANAAYSTANTGTAVSSAYTQANTARDHANSAFGQANTATTNAGNAFGQANTATTDAGNAFGQANTARTHANAAFGQANTATTDAGNAFSQANTARTHANTAHLTANAAFDQANTARTQANTARDHANSAFGQANTATTNAGNAFGQANTARDHANAAFAAANSKLSLTGGTITGNLAITGSLTVAGNTYVIDAENLRVSDPLIYLAGNNYVSDIVDIGFIGNYVNATGSNVHTGLYREHEDKMYYLFQGYDAEPANNHIGAFSNNMTLAVLNADLRTSNLTLGGVNAITWITSSFNQANTARDHANVAFGQANTALTTGQAAFGQANTALTTGQAAFGQANTGTTIASAAYDYANSAARNAFVTIAANGTNVVADSNNDTLTITPVSGISIVGNGTTDTIEIGLTNTGVTATTYGSATAVGVFTVDAQGRITAASNASIAISATAITSGTLPVSRGGTGEVSFTQNGILYGNTAGALKITSAGTEGQVLQASSTGVPQFAMLDGGTF